MNRPAGRYHAPARGRLTGGVEKSDYRHLAATAVTRPASGTEGRGDRGRYGSRGLASQRAGAVGEPAPDTAAGSGPPGGPASVPQAKSSCAWVRFGADQVDAAQVGLGQVGAGQVGVAQVGAAQVGAGEVGALQLCIEQGCLL